VMEPLDSHPLLAQLLLLVLLLEQEYLILT
jgi:hypothetical protein